ncbi:MAG: hypothetical protein ACXVB4_06920 [Pseudobdellovibrionaceae bacterium]
MKRQKWTCQNIKIKFKILSDEELKQSLADLWEILVPLKSQFNLQFQKVRIETPNRLSKPLRRTRR